MAGARPFGSPPTTSAASLTSGTRRDTAACPLPPAVPAELLGQRLDHEFLDGRTLLHAGEPNGTVDLLRNTGRQLGHRFVVSPHVAFLLAPIARLGTVPTTAAVLTSL